MTLPHHSHCERCWLDDYCGNPRCVCHIGKHPVRQQPSTGPYFQTAWGNGRRRAANNGVIHGICARRRPLPDGDPYINEQWTWDALCGAPVNVIGPDTFTEDLVTCDRCIEKYRVLQHGGDPREWVVQFV